MRWYELRGARRISYTNFGPVVANHELVEARVRRRDPEWKNYGHCVAIFKRGDDMPVGWVDFPNGAVYVTRECEL